MQKNTVYCLGRVIVDLYADQLQTPLSQVSSFSKYLGGSAGNTAFGLARLGADVGLISRVGSDEFGTFLLNRLQQEGVNTNMVAVDPANPTALGFASIFPPGDSKVLFYRKPCADNHLSIHDIDDSKLGGMLVVAATALAESPAREATLYALEVNRAMGGHNVIDLDWRPNLWTDHKIARLYYRIALSLADTVLANEPELEFAGQSAEPRVAAANIMALGPGRVVAKRGGAGVLLFGEGGPIQVAPLKVEVMNTLGAGDGFGSAYCYALLQGWDPEYCLTFAAAAGAIVVSRHSCSEAMPTREEIEVLLQSQGRSLSGH